MRNPSLVLAWPWSPVLRTGQVHGVGDDGRSSWEMTSRTRSMEAHDYVPHT